MKISKYKKREQNNVTKSTMKSRVSGMKSLGRFVGGGEPDIEDVEEWVEHLIDRYNEGEIKASTIREYFKAVRYYFRTVRRSDHDEDAFDDIVKWLPSNDSDPGDYLTEEEWLDVYNNLYSKRNRAIFNLMYHYARRPREIIFMNKEDIDFDGERGEDDTPTVRFLILKKKGERLPNIKIGDEERKLFRATYELKGDSAEVVKDAMNYMPQHTETIVEAGEEREVEPLFTTSNGRISYSTVRNAVKDAAKRAGIEDKNVTPKVMRHSRATHLDWDGHAPGNIGRDMLIHAPDTNVIGRYVHDRGEGQVREVMSIREDTE